MLRVTLVLAVLALVCAAPARAARTVGLDAGDAVHVYVAGSDGALYHAPPGGVLARVGGTAVGPVAVVRTASGELTTFARGADDGLYQDQTKVADGIAGSPDALLDAAGKPVAFARGTDGAIWRFSEGTWEALGGDPVAGDPTAIRDSSGKVVVFARGADGSLEQSSDGSDFAPAGSDKLSGEPAAVLTLGGTLETYARALDGSVKGAPITGNPAAVRDGMGRVHVFARGTDDALWEYFNGGWTQLGGALTGDPAAVADSFGLLHVVVPEANDEWASVQQVSDSLWGRFVSLGRAAPAPPATEPTVKPTPTPTPAPPIVVPALRRIIVSLSFTTKKPTKTSTSFKRLVVKNVPAGATVTATCATGCSRKSFTARNAYQTVSLERLIDRGALKVGTKVRVVVSMSHTIAAVQTLTVRAKRKPTVATRCLAPGATADSLC